MSGETTFACLPAIASTVCGRIVLACCVPAHTQRLVRRAGALLATIGVSDRAQFDIITDRAAPRGRLSFALPATRRSVLDQNSDAPGYSDTHDGALCRYGFGRGHTRSARR